MKLLSEGRAEAEPCLGLECFHKKEESKPAKELGFDAGSQHHFVAHRAIHASFVFDINTQQ